MSSDDAILLDIQEAARLVSDFTDAMDEDA